MQILLIEDELKLGQFLCDGLADAGHVCHHFTDGEQGLDAARKQAFDMIILDLMLPAKNGFEVLTALRQATDPPPILVLSALSDTSQVIKALDLGAIDYIKKPFDFQEMLARIRTIQRRRVSNASFSLGLGDLRMNLLNREVSRGSRKIILSSREFSLLEYLLTHSNQVVTKSQILNKVWNIHFDPGSNIVEVHIYQLRKKIEKEGGDNLIQTVIGKGYMLVGEVIKG